MKTATQKAYIALTIISVVWGTTFIAAKIGTMHMPGIFVTGIRQFTSGLLLTGFFLLKGEQLPALKDLQKISIQGILLLCIANGLITWSMEYISSSIAAIIVALVPLFTALFSVWLLKKTRLTAYMLLGLLAGFAGVFSLFYNPNEPIESLLNPGVLLALSSSIVWAFGTVYTSSHRSHTHMLFIAGLQMLAAGIVMLMVCFATGKYVNLAEAPLDSWYALAYLVVFGSLIAYSAYVFAISKLPPAMVSVYAYINPIVAIFCGWLLLKEKMSANLLLGSLIILFAIFLVNREFKKQQSST